MNATCTRVAATVTDRDRDRDARVGQRPLARRASTKRLSSVSFGVDPASRTHFGTIRTGPCSGTCVSRRLRLCVGLSLGLSGYVSAHVHAVYCSLVSLCANRRVLVLPPMPFAANGTVRLNMFVEWAEKHALSCSVYPSASPSASSAELCFSWTGSSAPP